MEHTNLLTNFASLYEYCTSTSRCQSKMGKWMSIDPAGLGGTVNSKQSEMCNCIMLHGLFCLCDYVFFFQALIDLLPHIHNSKYNSHTIGQLWPYSWHISCCFFTLCTHWMYFYTIMNQNYRILCIFCLICKGLYIACQNGKSNVQNFKYKTGTTAGQQLYRWSFLNEQKRKNRQTISSFNCNWRSWQVLMIY